MSNPSAVDAAPVADAPTEPPLGDKTIAAVFSILYDSYRQEVAAEEDVHRTLPFFATALGLVVASLNYSATQLPAWTTVLTTCRRGRPAVPSWQIIPCAWSVWLAGLLLLAVVGLSVAVLAYLGLATRRRDYERIGPERVIVERTRQLNSYYAGTGIADDELDAAVTADIRIQLLDAFSEIVPKNRNVTLQRYQNRARAVLCLLWSLLFALIATILIVATTKFHMVGASP